MEFLLHDLRQAARALRLRPAFAAAVVATLALGIGANTAVFSYVHALLLRRLPFAEPERLVRIETVRGEDAGPLSSLEVRDLNDDTRLFAGVASFRLTQYTITGDGPPEAAVAAMTTHNLYDLLGVRPVLGTTWPPADDGRVQYAVVLSDRLWKRRYGGDPAVVGKTVTLDAHGYTVLGVLPPGFTFPVDADIFRRVPPQDFASRGVRTAAAVARLAPGVAPAAAQRELDAVAARLARLYPATNAGVRFRLSPLRELWLGGARPYLVLLAWAVGFVLLLACVNAATLSLAHAIARGRETVVRVALGAGRARVAWVALAETGVLAIAGGVAGVAVAVLAIRALDALVRIERPGWMAVRVNGTVLAFTAVAVAVATAGTGLAPALHAARTDPGAALAGAGRTATGGGRYRLLRWLVATQVALAVVLLVGAGLMARSLDRLRATALGFDPARVLTLRTDPPWSRYNTVAHTAPFYRRVLDELAALPGVEAAAATDVLPLASGDARAALHRNLPTVEGRSAAEQEEVPFVNLRMVSPGYFAALRTPVVAGRAFERQDTDSTPPVAVVSEALARRLWPGTSPIGKRLRLGQLNGNYRPMDAEQARPLPSLTVVGVAGDVREGGIAGPEGLDLYVSNQQLFTPDSYLLVRPHAASGRPPAALAAAVRDAVWRADPEIAVFDVRPMTDRVTDTIWQQRLAGALLLAFGTVALALAAVGIYGVVAFTVAERTGEIGVRMALGATRGGVLRLVLGDAMRVVGVGLAAGTVGALLLARVAATLWYGVGAADPLTVAAAIVALAAVAVAAAYGPARRAARVEPITVLGR
jgi:putative ABC transport system permease protein